MCTFLLTYPLLFSDLRQAVCMRSVLNPDSTTVVKSCISLWLWIVSVRCASDLCCRVESLETLLTVAYVRNDVRPAERNQLELQNRPCLSRFSPDNLRQCARYVLLLYYRGSSCSVSSSLGNLLEMWHSCLPQRSAAMTSRETSV